MRYLSQLFACIIVIAMGSTIATAQQAPQQEQPEVLQSEEVSDQELDQFVNAIQFVESVQQQSQPRMLKAIEDQGMEPQEYIEAAQAQQQGQDTGLDDDKKEKFAKVQNEIQNIQMEANSQIEKKIEDEDLTIDRFNQLFLSYQQNQEIQERVQSKMQEFQQLER